MVKGTRATKVKVLFQGLHMTRVVFVLVYNFKICILGTPLGHIQDQGAQKDYHT
jgi:hypothetical protein